VETVVEKAVMMKLSTREVITVLPLTVEKVRVDRWEGDSELYVIVWLPVSRKPKYMRGIRRKRQ
jgi:hypothetical protein